MRLGVAALAFAAACDGSCGLDLERMIDQPRYTAFEPCAPCPHGTIMMDPPEGTVSRTAVLGPSALVTGRVDGRPVTAIPIGIDGRVLERGRNRYDVFCAACHGRRGNGATQVAENMALRPPPSLIAAPYTRYAAGRLYAVITEGFGLMRSYAAELAIRDRWAIVAYLQALQLSQQVSLDQLPPPQREEAKRWLR